VGAPSFAPFAKGGINKSRVAPPFRSQQRGCPILRLLCEGWE